MPLRTEQDPYLEQPQLQKMQYLGCNVTYQGTPSLEIEVDGTSRFGPTAMPNPGGASGGLHNRTIWLPYLCFGFKPDLKWTVGNVVEKYDWISVHPSTFKERKLWDGIDFTFEGTVTVTVELDGVDQTGALALSPTMVLTTSLPQDTRRLYFPFGSFAYKVNIGTDHTTNGQVLNWEPVVNTDRMYDSLLLATQFQVSFVGDCTVQLGIDGSNHGTTYSLTGSGTSQLTEQHWIDPGCRGHYFQFRQTAGTGKIIHLKTNEARTDQEEPETVKPEEVA